MKSTFMNWLNRLMSSLIALTSVAGCSCATSTPQDEPVCMYGVPTAYFTVRGTVTNKHNEPLEGIQVQISVSNDRKDTPLEERDFRELQSYDYDTQSTVSTFSTDKDGKYEVKEVEFDYGGGMIKVVFTDPDNVYKTDSVYNDQPEVDYRGAWETGYEYTVDMQMQKGKSANNKKKK